MNPFTKENLENRIYALESSYMIETEPDFLQILENQKIVDTLYLKVKSKILLTSLFELKEIIGDK